MTIEKALESLRPGATWTIIGNSTYENITWTDETQTKPTKAEVTAKVALLTSAAEAVAYKKLRSKEYPDFKDYLDGVVKGDQVQIQAYIDACQAVKDKYPKP